MWSARGQNGKAPVVAVGVRPQPSCAKVLHHFPPVVSYSFPDFIYFSCSLLPAQTPGPRSPVWPLKTVTTSTDAMASLSIIKSRQARHTQGRGRQISIRWKPAWSTKGIWGQPQVHSETLTEKSKNKNKKSRKEVTLLNLPHWGL